MPKRGDVIANWSPSDGLLEIIFVTEVTDSLIIGKSIDVKNIAGFTSMTVNDSDHLGHLTVHNFKKYHWTVMRG